MSSGAWIYLIILASLFTLGCESAYKTVHFLPQNPVECNKRTKTIYVFREGDHFDFRYHRLGNLELNDKKGETQELLMDNLLLKAGNVCANAVLGVHFDNYEEWSEEHGVQNIKVLKGIAVRVQEDSAFKARYRLYGRSNFLKNLQREQANYNAISFVSFLLVGTIVVVALLIGPSEEE